MNRLEGKPSTETEDYLPSDSRETEVRLNESHRMTLNRPFGETPEGVELSSISTEYHLTISVTNDQLSRRELSLLLDILNYQACIFGINFTMALAMYELYFRLLGNKRNSSEIRENRIRLTVTVSETILKVLKGTDFSLYPGNVRTLPPKLIEILRIGLMSKRTYGSRYRTYRPEKFLRVRIVPVDIQFLKRRKDSIPYSGYTKGYGESHPSARRQHTRPSAELDGSGESPAEVEEHMLFTQCSDPIHLLSNILQIRYKNEFE